MPIIKNVNAAKITRSAVVLDLGDIAQQAAKIKAAAELHAVEIIQKAQAEVQQRLQSSSDQGYESGFAKGQEAGYLEGLEKGKEQGFQKAFEEQNTQLQQIQTAWHQAASELDQYRQQLGESSQQAVLEFALKLAEKVIFRVVELDETVVLDQLDMALRHVTNAHDVTVYINASDRLVLEQTMPHLLNRFRDLKHIHLVDDENVHAGGCVVKHDKGEVDVSLETQLSRIVELLLPRPQNNATHDNTAAVGEASNNQTSNEAATELSSIAANETNTITGETPPEATAGEITQ